ncbi:MAG: hypothetical protein IT379_27980 [Deltaproteobacteria bacterium]|nr:hypothetical protein [Deltaproteobacteria bacterium]
MSGTVRAAGVDLGKATVKIAVVEHDAATGRRRVVRDAIACHEGKPLEVFRSLYPSVEAARCAALGATGLHGDVVHAPALGALPEDACLEAALWLLPAGPLRIVNVGARGYGVLVRDGEGRTALLESDKCSSGTGETMAKMAGRFGLGIEEADRLASATRDEIPITARCSVFAKSELTHYANQGKPTDALLRGYIGSIASHVAGLVERAGGGGPVFAIGGGASLVTFRAALASLLGAEVVVPSWARHLEAIGAACIALEQIAQRGDEAAHRLPESASGLLRSRPSRVRALPSARCAAHRVIRLPAWAIDEDRNATPSVLGLDLGSTGSKAVLTSLATGAPLHDVYDRTRGNPVEAARRLVEAVLAAGAPEVRAIAVTGSGREAVATVLRAAYPDLGPRLVVENEIVAHATAAVRCDPGRGASLSVVEIGGQDAKFIQIASGQIVESGMNKACSAGTGSFLEEQANLYGIHDVGELHRLSATATRVPELGQMCTVFVVEAAAEAEREGFVAAEIFAGFQRSVLQNYLNRVMEQRTFGKTILFQGKPAESEPLAWTLASLSGRDVVVPPNPGAMGAWGIGLCARAALPGAVDGPRVELTALLGAKVEERSEIRCRDKGCSTYCTIERAVVRIGGVERRTVLSGGACPKFEVSTAARPKLPADAPDVFHLRDAALHELSLADDLDEDAPPVGVPLVGALAGRAPWLAGLLAGLGARPMLMASTARSLANGEKLTTSYDACAPVKIAHGVVAAAELPVVLLPVVEEVDDGLGDQGKTCPMEQAMPEMIRSALSGRDGARLVSPKLGMGRGLLGDRLAARSVAAALDLPVARADRAIARAEEAQRAWTERRRRIGRDALAYARAGGHPAVALVGMAHVVHDRAVNADIPRILRDHGVVVLPAECVPLGADHVRLPDVPWADARTALEVGLWARGEGDVYPVWLSAFGCGPGSFVEQAFAALLDGHPHVVLESDGHGGAAGYVTRLQAFLHTVRAHDRRPSSASPARLAMMSRVPAVEARAEPGAPPIAVFSLGDQPSAILAAAYRSTGRTAVPTRSPSVEMLELGRRDCSGKECVAYQLVWGAFREHVERTDGAPVELAQVGGSGMCRNCLFAAKDQLSLERAGHGDRVRVGRVALDRRHGLGFLGRVWAGVVAWDLLRQMRDYLRATEREPGGVDAVYGAAVAELPRILERPATSGLGGVSSAIAIARDVTTLLDRAARDLAAAVTNDASRADLRTVLLSGDVYVRLDDFANDGLCRKLADRGVRVLLEPASVLAEYFALHGLDELVGLPEDPAEAAAAHALMGLVRRTLYARVRRWHPWLPRHDAGAAHAAAHARGATSPVGEAPITVGSVLHHWADRACDGVVLASPWGCGPALVAESLLRAHRDIPLLTIYTDGSPIDERRLGAFTFRLRRSPARSSRRHAA